MYTDQYPLEVVVKVSVEVEAVGPVREAEAQVGRLLALHHFYHEISIKKIR